MKPNEASSAEVRIRQNVILEKIDNLHSCVDRIEKAFNENRTELISSIKDHEVRITKMEANLDILLKISWILFASSMGVVVTAFWRLLFVK